jgi:hypothetical protein
MRNLLTVSLALTLSACTGGDGPGTSGGTLLLAGTACSTPLEFATDAPITVWLNGAGDLVAVGVFDGQVFDTEDEAAWGSYAQQSDVFLGIYFDDPEPATAHGISAIFDSLFGAAGIGVVGFMEHNMGEHVEISHLDMQAGTIELDLQLPVYGHVDSYPPVFDDFVQCEQGTLSGQIGGAFAVQQLP